MSHCKGCGIPLQSTNPNGLGYTPKENTEYCQRCFRLRHYDDVMYSMKQGIPKEEVLDAIQKMDGKIIWVLDAFDLEASMIPGMHRHLADKEILAVLSKRDLLPNDVPHQKIAEAVFARFEEYGIPVQELRFTSSKSKEGIQELRELLINDKAQTFIFMGRANSGKSTLINQLLEEDQITSSHYPGTTLDTIQIEKFNKTFIDTPGIESENSMLLAVEDEYLKEIIPSKEIKPQIYQLDKDQSFAIGGLARIDLYGCKNCSIVFYVSERLKLHRGKLENAKELWDNHYGELLRPIPMEKDFKSYRIGQEKEKIDIVIDGLGWCCISGSYNHLEVFAPSKVIVTFRKALI
ncbi:MAG: ribosome biogenesis GTPase YqeH [Solobacterium sp.]|nr:ribosome biogenesis GTPase YqeH [Solobacterium sp.]